MVKLFFKIYAHEDPTHWNLQTCAAHCSATSMLFMSVIHLRTAVSGSDDFTRKGLMSSFLTNKEMQHMLSPLVCLHNATQGAL